MVCYCSKDNLFSLLERHQIAVIANRNNASSRKGCMFCRIRNQDRDEKEVIKPNNILDVFLLMKITNYSANTVLLCNYIAYFKTMLMKSLMPRNRLQVGEYFQSSIRRQQCGLPEERETSSYYLEGRGFLPELLCWTQAVQDFWSKKESRGLYSS